MSTRPKPPVKFRKTNFRYSDGRVRERLNLQVEIVQPDHTKLNVVTCGDFSWLLFDHGTEIIDLFQSRTLIKECFERPYPIQDVRRDFNEFCSMMNGRNTKLVARNMFNSFIKDQIRMIQDKPILGPTRFLVVTPIHALVFQIEPTFSGTHITWYDAEETTSNYRFTDIDNVEEIPNLVFFSDCYRDGKWAYGDVFAISQRCWDFESDNLSYLNLDTKKLDTLKDAIFLAANRKNPEVLSSLLKGVFENINVTRDFQKDLKSILTAKNMVETPALNMVMQNGYFETLKVLTNYIVHLGLDEDGLTQVLAAKRADDMSGLLLALQNGHAETISAFGELLGKSNLGDDSIMELLIAKQPRSGDPSVLMAVFTGNVKVIEAYGNALLKCGLKWEKIVQILDKVDTDKMTEIVAKNGSHAGNVELGLTAYYEMYDAIKDKLNPQVRSAPSPN